MVELDRASEFMMMLLKRKGRKEQQRVKVQLNDHDTCSEYDRLFSTHENFRAQQSSCACRVLGTVLHRCFSNKGKGREGGSCLQKACHQTSH
jgi:hypothetical protein